MGQQILTPIVRPRAYSTYNIELGAQVCEAIGDGMLLDEIAKLRGMPSAATIYSWIGKHPEFAVMYEAALMARFDMDCETLKAIAKGQTHPYVKQTKDKKGNVTETTTTHVSEDIECSRLRIETMKWIMTKRLPRIYGEPSRPPAPQQCALEVRR